MRVESRQQLGRIKMQGIRRLVHVRHMLVSALHGLAIPDAIPTAHKQVERVAVPDQGRRLRRNLVMHLPDRAGRTPLHEIRRGPSMHTIFGAVDHVVGSLPKQDARIPRAAGLFEQRAARRPGLQVVR